MSLSRMIGAWLAIVGVPLIPVVILYGLFGNQNYFGLDGWAKGLVATGPVAAYVFLVHQGWRIFRGLPGLLGLSASTRGAGLTGDWTFESATPDESTVRQGSCHVELRAGALRLDGDYRAPTGQLMGRWASTVTAVDATRLVFLYTLDEILAEGAKHQEGVCWVRFSGVHPERMEGQWRILGDSQSLGNITLIKGPPSAPSGSLRR